MAVTWQCGGAPRVRVPAMPAPGASGLPWMGLMGIPCGGIVLSACQYPGGINLTSVSEATKARGVTDLPLAADPESTPAPTATVDDAHGDCGCDGECNHHHGYLDNKENYLKRLRRIEGQVRGLQKMVLDEKYCIDILTQISATSKALQSVALAMLDEHMSTCVVRAAREGGDEAEIKLAEASDAIARLVRS